MAQYSSGARGWTPIAYADGATLADAAHHSLRSSTAGRADRITEVYIGGEASSTTVNRMSIRRIATNAGTPTDVVPQPLNPLSVACDAKGFVAAGTDPILAATPTDLLNLAFNAFGGVVRWVAAPGEEIWILGSTAPNAQIALSSISGAGVVSDHIIFEEL
jgi:hypothetical protein